MNWIDVVTIIILAVSSLYGLVTGLILSLVRIGSYLVAFVVARIYYKPLTAYIINNTSLYKTISGFIDGRITGLISNGNDIINNITQDTVQNLNIPKVLQKSLTTSIDGFAQGVDTISLTTIVSSSIINIFSIIIIFVAVRIIVMIVGRLLDKVASVPIINEFNKLGGFVFGFLKGALIVFIFTALLLPLASVAPNNFIVETLQSSTITKIFYDYNLVLYIFNEVLFSLG